MARNLTEKQQKFLDVLFEEAEGNPVTAKKLAGYSENNSTSAITSSLQEEIADLTKIERSSGSGVWNDKVKSISMMAWNQCTQHLFEDSCIDF